MIHPKTRRAGHPSGPTGSRRRPGPRGRFVERDAPASAQRHGKGQPLGDAGRLREIADELTASQFLGLLNQELRRGRKRFVHECRDQSRGHPDAGRAGEAFEGKR